MIGKASSILAAGLAATLISQSAAAETLTGCLTKYGRLVKLAVGDMPARPCGKDRTSGRRGEPGVRRLQSRAAPRRQRKSPRR